MFGEKKEQHLMKRTPCQQLTRTAWQPVAQETLHSKDGSTDACKYQQMFEANVI